MKKLKRKRKIKKSKIIKKKNILSFAVKVSGLLLIVCLSWFAVSKVGRTLGHFFNDNEVSSDNLYKADVLDFYLESPSNNFTPENTALNMTPGSSVSREIKVINQGKPFQYRIYTEKISGDDDFCAVLNLEAELEGEVKYSNGLMNLDIIPPINIGEDGQDDWLFIVSSAPGPDFGPGKSCEIKFVFEAWQENIANSFFGFSDTEEIASLFTAGGIKINKVYYDVDEVHGKDGKNEWVELYNPEAQAVNLKNWELCNNKKCKEISKKDLFLPAFGFALLSRHTSTWDFWHIPDEVIKIHKSFAKLDNDSDIVLLKDSNGNIVDQLNWGTADPDWKNYNQDVWNPGAVDVVGGNILARIPLGFDTNQAPDFKELSLPSVMVTSPNGGEIWWVGRTYDLRWIAVNFNGDDSLLSIDIWYSADSGDTWVNIVRGTENDGVYEWRVALVIDGYFIPSDRARIKVVAFGPDNFMVQDWDMSDEDFCPPIDYSLLTPEELKYLEDMGMLIGMDIGLNNTSEVNEIDDGLEDEETIEDDDTDDTENLENTEDIQNEEIIDDELFDEELEGEITDIPDIGSIETSTPEEEGVLVEPIQENEYDI